MKFLIIRTLFSLGLIWIGAYFISHSVNAEAINTLIKPYITNAGYFALGCMFFYVGVKDRS